MNAATPTTTPAFQIGQPVVKMAHAGRQQGRKVYYVAAYYVTAHPATGAEVILYRMATTPGGRPGLAYGENHLAPAPQA